MSRFSMSPQKRARLVAHSVKNDHSLSIVTLAEMFGCEHNLALTVLQEAGVYEDYKRQHISDKAFAEMVNRGFCKAFGGSSVASPVHFNMRWCRDA